MFRASLCPKHVEIILINNKSPFVASSWSHTYLLIEDARSLEHKVCYLMPGYAYCKKYSMDFTFSALYFYIVRRLYIYIYIYIYI